MGTDRIDALREAVRRGASALSGDGVPGGTATATSALPTVLDGVERSLLVSRSTLLVVALQLVLLAGCTLLLTARLLSAERAAETRLLRARGGSRPRRPGSPRWRRCCWPCPRRPAPRCWRARSPDCSPDGAPWTGSGWTWTPPSVRSPDAARCGWWPRGWPWAARRPSRFPRSPPPSRPAAPGTCPGAVRAGADLGLLVVAAVAYWQLSRRPSGVVGRDLGVDPLLVTAPALALLAGTVLTLRLLPPVARLAERRAVRGRGLPGALAGWQLGRRPARGAGPVLLLVLAVALGALAIGQGSSWERSQDDQADFRAGAPVRVLAAGEAGLGRTQAYAAVPGVSAAAPAYRAPVTLSGNRTATVLALDTAHAAGSVLIRPDLASSPVDALLDGLAPKGGAVGVRVPADTARLALAARVRGAGAHTAIEVRAVLEDRHGTPYKLTFGGSPPTAGSTRSSSTCPPSPRRPRAR
ncbi:hypothetical protein GCM10023238_01160 [Streptomyces heliomycini]